MTAKVILNPYSNRWNSQARWPETQAALKAAGVDFESAISERKGQVTDLAEQAARDGFSPIVVAGGDGTIGDAVNGLARAAKFADEPIGPLGIMPTGSANDLADNLGLPKDLGAAAKVIAAGKCDLIDLCKCNDRYFANNSAVGLEPYVSTKQEKIHWLKGVPRYLVAAIQGIMDKPAWNAKLKWDGGAFEGPLSLLSVGNGPRTGGIFFMIPHADPARRQTHLRVWLSQDAPRHVHCPAARHETRQGQLRGNGRHGRGELHAAHDPSRPPLARAHRWRTLPRIRAGFRVFHSAGKIEDSRAVIGGRWNPRRQNVSSLPLVSPLDPWPVRRFRTALRPARRLRRMLVHVLETARQGLQ